MFEEFKFICEFSNNCIRFAKFIRYHTKKLIKVLLNDYEGNYNETNLFPWFSLWKNKNTFIFHTRMRYFKIRTGSTSTTMRIKQEVKLAFHCLSITIFVFWNCNCEWNKWNVFDPWSKNSRDTVFVLWIINFEVRNI